MRPASIAALLSLSFRAPWWKDKWDHPWNTKKSPTVPFHTLTDWVESSQTIQFKAISNFKPRASVVTIIPSLKFPSQTQRLTKIWPPVLLISPCIVSFLTTWHIPHPHVQRATGRRPTYGSYVQRNKRKFTWHVSCNVQHFTLHYREKPAVFNCEVIFFFFFTRQHL